MKQITLFHPAMSAADAILLLRNLSIVLRAGVPLPRALSLFEHSMARRLRPTVMHLRQRVEEGLALADALDSAPRRFPSFVVNLVRMGELSGNLDGNLAEAVRYLQEGQDLRHKIRSALLYPCFILIAVVGLILAMGTIVLPKLIPLFESLGVDLPWTTRVLLRAAWFFEVYGMIFSFTTIGIVFSLVLITRLEALKPTLHQTFLRIPLVGKVISYGSVAQICSSMGTLLQSGIPLPEAIAATVTATGNRVFRRALATAIPFVRSGHQLSEGLQRSGNLFPAMALTLVEIGEETGTLEEMLRYLTDYYSREVEYAVKDMTTALEPLLLLVVGGIVGFTVIGIITPIYGITGNVG